MKKGNVGSLGRRDMCERGEEKAKASLKALQRATTLAEERRGNVLEKLR